MSDIQPVYKITDYRIAEGQGEVRMMLAEGWEPHGSAMLTSMGSIKQPMVKREMISVDQYIAMLETMMEVAKQVMERMK